MKNDAAEKRPTPVSPEKIMDLVSKADSARMRMSLEMCASCGLCADSCLFYTAHDNDPAYMPQAKVRATIGEVIRKKGNIDREFLRSTHQLLWGGCTMCRRCTQVCPFGIDIAGLIHLGRRVCHAVDAAPDEIKAIDDNYACSGNQMAIPEEDFIETLEWIEEEGEVEVAGLKVPINRKGARVMYAINPREANFYPQEITQAAQIFHVAGEDWTMPSKGWDCTNLPLFSGNLPLAASMTESMYRQAQELGVETVCLTECGHAWRVAQYEAPYWLGVEGGKPPVTVTHPVRLYLEFIKSGRIKLDPSKRITEPVTIQDPCSLSRNGGLADELREIVSLFASDVREMTPTREYNHCCGGGSGLIPMGGDWRKERMKAGVVKADQIRETGAKIVFTPCHNCHDQITDLSKEYDLGVKAMYLKDHITEAMLLPDDMVPREEG